MVHTMRLHPLPFSQIRNGAKTIEARLNDKKRQKVKVGDIVEFVLRTDPTQIIKCNVKELHRYNNFSDLFDSHPPVAMGASSREELNGIYQYYSKEDENKYGVIGIEIIKT